MHPIPNNLDLSGYVGAELGAMVLGPYAITFDFNPEARAAPGGIGDTLRIVAEGPWVMQDADGKQVSDSRGYALRNPCALNALLTARVISVSIEASEKIIMSFDSGYRLLLFTEIGGYESLNIVIPGVRDCVSF